MNDVNLINYKKPSVAVLLATFNGAKWLPQQLDSLLMQTGVDVSIFISDDCSIDNTEEIISYYAVKYQNIFILKSDVGFGGAAQNFFRLIRDVPTKDFDYFAFCDQDDIWLSDKLLNAVDCINKFKVDGYSASVLSYEEGVSNKRVLSQNSNFTKFDFFLEGGGQGCTYVLSSQFFHLVKNLIVEFPDRISLIHYHDWLIYAVARAKKSAWYFDDRICMLYRQHSLNDTGSRLSIRGIFFRFKRLTNGWYFNQVVAIAEFLESCVGLNSEEIGFKKILLGRFSVPLLFILVINGRRRFFDRFATLFMFLKVKWLS